MSSFRTAAIKVVHEPPSLPCRGPMEIPTLPSALDDPTAAAPPLQQQPAEEICAVCLEPLRFQILEDKSRIPIDDRLLFHPSNCRQFHSFHLLCAKSVAKSDALAQTTLTAIAINCPVCRTGYPIEDIRRLLPLERLISLKFQVCPIDETSEYDLFLSERYDPNCRYPRNPAERHKADRHIMTRTIPSSILPLAPTHSCHQCPSSTDQQQPSPKFFLQPHPIRLLEHLVQQRQSSRSTLSPTMSVFLKSASAHADLNRALNSLDDAASRLRRRRRRPRVFKTAAPSISERVTRSRSLRAAAFDPQQLSAEIQQQQQQQQQELQLEEQKQKEFDFKNAIVERIESKLTTMRNNMNELATDLWEYGLAPNQFL